MNDRIRQKNGQAALFPDCEGTLWANEWHDMPEFVQEDLTPFKSLIVHFETQEDLDKFSELVGRKLYTTTQSIWFPEEEIGRYSNKRFNDGP